ncbi:MAG: acetyl-CoA carboxylase, carboxyltransferase subunit beta [Erysipelotrichaceae bacterium]|nr:acetyl-CoA carboxylase, carboxyltransferase subunit beta [Erysipelotrichaceae bacterium]
MNIFNKRKEKLNRFKDYIYGSVKTVTPRKSVPDVIMVCPNCKAATTRETLEKHLYVCYNCFHHLTIGADERIKILLDAKSFREIDANATSKNHDYFCMYQEKLDQAISKTNHNEAFVGGIGKINGHKVCFGVLDSNFIMGSMGYVVGDKVTRLIETATKKKYPLILIIASGGARMQEGIISLMQMVKTSAALAIFNQAGGLYISILTKPTTGGVSASFAMLGDIILAEPDALIGFAGKRVIEKTINESLPDNFQTSEFLLERGFLDKIVKRSDLKRLISDLLEMHKQRRTQYDTIRMGKSFNSSRSK